jgi:hypothetical protein
MLRVALFALVLAAIAGCGVAAPTKPEPVPKAEPKPEPPPEVYDKVAPMPREAKRN